MKNYLDVLGLPAKDKVTGFKGIISSISFDLYGCIQVVITPKSEDGTMKDGHWLDSGRVTITSRKRVMEISNFGDKNILEYDKGPAEKPRIETKF